MGIGTRSPQSLLDVNGTLTETGLSITGADLNPESLPKATEVEAGADIFVVVIDARSGKLHMQ